DSRHVLLGFPVAKGRIDPGPPAPTDLFSLKIKANLKRFGGEVSFAVESKAAQGLSLPSLIKAVARGHDWFLLLSDGKIDGGRGLAKLTDLDERYISRI